MQTAKSRSPRNNIFKVRPPQPTFDFTKECTKCGEIKPFESFNHTRTHQWYICCATRCNVCKHIRYSERKKARNDYNAAVTKLIYTYLVEEGQVKTEEGWRREKITSQWMKLSKAYIKAHNLTISEDTDPDCLIEMMLAEDVNNQVWTAWLNS